MSNYNKKFKKNKTRKNPIKKVCDLYSIPFDFEEKGVVEVGSYNTKYFSSSSEFINSYGLVIIDYSNFCNKNKKEMKIIDFIKDSVENNSMLNDSLNNVNFNVIEDHILFELNEENQDFINMGEFYINNHRFNVCSSYLFIEDIIYGTQYLYYGD